MAATRTAASRAFPFIVFTFAPSEANHFLWHRARQLHRRPARQKTLPGGGVFDALYIYPLPTRSRSRHGPIVRLCFLSIATHGSVSPLFVVRINARSVSRLTRLRRRHSWVVGIPLLHRSVPWRLSQGPMYSIFFSGVE